MGENLDLQKLLDQHILEYMRKKNMPVAAEIFATEANLTPDPPALADPDPNGFLTEWWSIFWPTLASQYAKNPDETASNVMTPQTVQMPEFPNVQQTEISTTMAIAPNMMPTPGYSAPTMMLRPELNPIGSSVNPFYVNDDSSPMASNFTPQNELMLPNPRQTEISSTMATSPNVMPRPEVDPDAVDARRRRKQFLTERRQQIQRLMISDPPAVDQLASIPTSSNNPSTSGNTGAEPIAHELGVAHLELPELSETGSTASPNPISPDCCFK